MFREKELDQRGLRVVKLFVNKKYMDNNCLTQSWYDFVILEIEAN
jgi:hypothetical protein